jgi:hypothetical protein
MCCCEDTINNSGEPINGGGGGASVPEVMTYSALQAKTGMQTGDLVYATDLGIGLSKLWVYTGDTWQVSGETIELEANENLSIGQLVEISGTDNRVIRTNSAGDVGFVGVVQFRNTLLGEKATIAVNGVWLVGCVVDTYNVANYLRPSSTLGLAEETTLVSNEPFAKICETTSVLVNGGLVKAVLHTQEIY